MWEEGFSRLKKRMLLYSIFPFLDIIVTSYFCPSPDYEGTDIVKKAMLDYQSVQLGAVIGIAWGALLPTIGFAFVWFMGWSWILKNKPQYLRIIFTDLGMVFLFMPSAILSYLGGLSWVFNSLVYPWNFVAVGIGPVLYLAGEIFYVRSFGVFLTLLKEVFSLEPKKPQSVKYTRPLHWRT